jgi:hypothetical protein
VVEVKSEEEIELVQDLPETVHSELDESRWSVVSFDKPEAGGLTYSKAVEFMSKLDSNRVAGLCIVTDEAAERLRG